MASAALSALLFAAAAVAPGLGADQEAPVCEALGAAVADGPLAPAQRGDTQAARCAGAADGGAADGGAADGGAAGRAAGGAAGPAPASFAEALTGKHGSHSRVLGSPSQEETGSCGEVAFGWEHFERCDNIGVIKADVKRTPTEASFGERDCAQTAAVLAATACARDRPVSYSQGMHEVAKLAVATSGNVEAATRHFQSVLTKSRDAHLWPFTHQGPQHFWSEFIHLAHKLKGDVATAFKRKRKALWATENPLYHGVFLKEWTTIFSGWLPLVFRKNVFDLVQKDGADCMVAVTLAIVQVHGGSIGNLLNGQPDSLDGMFFAESRDAWKAIPEEIHDRGKHTSFQDRYGKDYARFLKLLWA